MADDHKTQTGPESVPPKPTAGPVCFSGREGALGASALGMVRPPRKLPTQASLHPPAAASISLGSLAPTKKCLCT